MRKLLLIYAPSFRRIEAELDAFGDRIEVQVLNEAGALDVEGQAQISWSNADLYNSAHGPRFNRLTMASSRLEWMQTGAAGLDNPMFAELLARGVRLSSSHAQAPAISEFVMHCALDHLQRGPERRAAQDARRWERLHFSEVAGTRWLVIGFGAVGQAVARRAKAFGAEVVGVRRSAGGDPWADSMITPDHIAESLPGADVVVLCLPLSDATRGLADAGFFARMKQGSLLVNVSRGAVVDEEALVAALDQGVPATAALDVFAVEPLPPHSPLWTHPRVMLTAHASSLGSGLQARGDALFLRNLNHFLAGEALENEVRRGAL